MTNTAVELHLIVVAVGYRWWSVVDVARPGDGPDLELRHAPLDTHVGASTRRAGFGWESVRIKNGTPGACADRVCTHFACVLRYYDSMFSQVLTPGEYPCEWFIDATWHPGVIKLFGSVNPTGEVFDYNAKQKVSGEPSRFRIEKHEKIVGRLRNRMSLALCNAALRVDLTEHAAVSGKYAVCGYELDTESLEFDGVEFQITGLVELSGTAPIELINPPESEENERQYSMKWRSESEQEWFINEDCVCLGFGMSAHIFDPYSFSVKTSPTVYVRGERRSLQSWIDQYVLPIREIASTSMRQGQTTCWIVLCNNPEGSGSGDRRGERLAQVFGSDLTQEPYTSDARNRLRTPLIECGPDGAGLDVLIPAWLDLRARCETFIDLLKLGLGEDLSTRAMFLTLVPALESYHSVTAGEGYYSQEEHKAKLDAIYAKIKPALSSRQLRRLKRFVDKRGYYGLNERLRFMFESMDDNLRTALQPHVDAARKSLEALIFKNQDAWDLIANIRNDLAHGGPNHGNDQIRQVLPIVQTIAIAATLRELGIPTVKLAEEITQLGFPR